MTAPGSRLLVLAVLFCACSEPSVAPPGPGPRDAAGTAPGADASQPGADAAHPGADAAIPSDAMPDAAPDAATCPEGTACDDGDPCTTGDSCRGGACTGTPKVCDAPSACLVHPGTCDPASGSCTYTPRPATWPCDDGDACTLDDHCDGKGACTGTPKVCDAPAFQCRAVPGTCAPATGACTYGLATLGAPCSDGEACTVGDACDDRGVCQSGAAAVCTTPPDSCHRSEGSCDSAQGCVYPLKSTGTGCDDGDPCTVGESCSASGVCGSGQPAQCVTPPSDCSAPSGTCVAGKGCVYDPKPKGTGCTDGSLCTTGDACDGSGQCVGTPRVCAAPGSCLVGSCDLADGQCKTTPAASGTACEVANGTAACDGAGACAVSACDAGFAPLGSGCANLAAGFQKNSSACLSCGASNPFGAACTCPTGFGDQALRVVSDCAGAGTLIGSELHLCQTTGLSAEADFGGAYQQDDAGPCSTGCRVPNPVTGACSCPAGTAPVTARSYADSATCPTQVVLTRLTLCVSTTAPVTSFAGAYQQDDSVPGGLGCRAANPRTSDCTCPTGTTSKLRVRMIAPGAGATDVGTNLYLCVP